MARVELGSQQYDQSCTLDGQPSVALSIYQLPGSNALDTAAGVYAKMKELKARFPDGLDYQIVYDTTPFIRESVNEVFNTLRDAVILVAIVVLVFLQDWRAMILPMIDVPVSLIGTFAVMAALGFTLNNLTLFGLVLAIGIVVDDAIVVLENIERLIATGLDAARPPRSRRWTRSPARSSPSPWCSCAVFIPCCFLGGITGQFFRQFAVTIAVSTIISAINALTMTPSRAVADLQDRGRRRRPRAQARGAALVDLRRPRRPADRLARARVPGRPVGLARGAPAGGRRTMPTWLSLGRRRRLFRSRRAGRRPARLVHHPARSTPCWAGSSAASTASSTG